MTPATGGTDRLRRSLLYTPADDESMVRKAAGTDADAVIYDLQDAVEPDRKDVARETLREVVPTLAFDGTEVCTRINRVGGDRWVADLTAAVAAGVDAVSLPLVEAPWQVRAAVATARGLVEEAGGGPADVPEFLVILETPAGVFGGAEIARACGGLAPVTALTFGATDYARAVGAAGGPGRVREFLATHVVGYAALGGLAPIASVYPEVGDAEGLREAAEAARAVGFLGQSVIHPDQVPVVNEAFTPDPETVAHARDTLERFAASDEGAMLIDGTFVDEPVAERYRRIVARAEAVDGA